MQQIFIFKNLEPANVWHFCSKTHCNDWSTIKTVANNVLWLHCSLFNTSMLLHYDPSVSLSLLPSHTTLHTPLTQMLLDLLFMKHAVPSVTVSSIFSEKYSLTGRQCSSQGCTKDGWGQWKTGFLLSFFPMKRWVGAQLTVNECW